MAGEKQLTEADRLAVQAELTALRKQLGAKGWDLVTTRLNEGAADDEVITRQSVERAAKGDGGLKVKRAVERYRSTKASTTTRIVVPDNSYEVVEEELRLAAAISAFTEAHAIAVRERVGRLKGEPSPIEVRQIIKQVIRDVEDRRREYFPDSSEVPADLDEAPKVPARRAKR